MSSQKLSHYEDIRSRVSHPIVDGRRPQPRAHTGLSWILWPISAGGALRNKFEQKLRVSDGWAWAQMSDDERRYSWRPARAWWAAPASNTLDRATVSLPRLMNERMGRDWNRLCGGLPDLATGFVALRG